MAPQLVLVYGFIADPSLLVTDFHHVLRFNEHTVGIGVVVDSKPYNGFMQGIEPEQVRQVHGTIEEPVMSGERVRIEAA
jgi:hypothetical protein